MEKYFGTIPSRPAPHKAITVEARQRGEKRIRVMADSQPHLLMGWHKPTFPDKDMYVIEVIQFLMTRSGRSSRLYERLVKKDGICNAVESFTAPGDKYPNLYCLWLTPRSPHTAAEAEKAAMEEIERLKTEPVPKAELEKVRNQIDAAFLSDLETNLGLARRFATYYIAARDPDVLDRLREEMKAVTADDIMRVAREYLVDENRTVAELVTEPRVSPVGKAGGSGDGKRGNAQPGEKGKTGDSSKSTDRKGKTRK
jgi:predicted Zn-dependent peptidase